MPLPNKPIKRIDIACPSCGNQVSSEKLTPKPQEEVVEGVFKCPCGHNAIVDFRFELQH